MLLKLNGDIHHIHTCTCISTESEDIGKQESEGGREGKEEGENKRQEEREHCEPFTVSGSWVSMG